MLALKNKRDLVAGGLLATVGLVAAYLSKSLAYGSISKMGAGFMPATLSWCVVGLGVIVLFRSFLVEDDPPEWPRFRPFAFVFLGPVLFAALIEPLGLVLTIIIVTMFVRYATAQKLTLRSLVFPVVLAAGCAIVFAYLLNIALPLWP
jgi:membrane-associated HD superfamily phosphohydrolase